MAITCLEKAGWHPNVQVETACAANTQSWGCRLNKISQGRNRGVKGCDGEETREFALFYIQADGVLII